MVYQKLTRLLAPRIGLYFGVMLAFAGITALLGETQAAVAEAGVVRTPIPHLPLRTRRILPRTRRIPPWTRRILP